MNLGDNVRDSMSAFTAAERKVATALLADYPFAGLLTVAELAKRANVSGQSILRFSGKLGFASHSAFQQALISEMKESLRSPVSLRATLAGSEPEGDFLAALAESICRSVRKTSALVSRQSFEAVCALIGDPRRSIYTMGGRISDSLARYLSIHLRQIRAKVYHVPAAEEEWPEYLLRMGRRDVVVIFDFRRYQRNLERFARVAHGKRGAQIVLITDVWLSPVSRHATHVLPVEIDVGTAWDTAATPVLILEGIINRVADGDWSRAQARIEAWDRLRVTRPGAEGAAAAPEEER